MESNNSSDKSGSMKTATLYKKSSTGKIQLWSAEAVKTETGWLLQVTSGQKGGKMTTSAGQVIDEGKQGRNATQQAEFEMKSLAKKKIDSGYFDSEEKANSQIKILPMLALPFDKRKHNITYPAIVQRKFDGVRCLLRIDKDGEVTLLSRKGKEFPHLDHIKSEAATVLKEEIILDGELYSDTLTFQELVGLVKRVTLKPGNDKQMLEVSVRVYDLIAMDKLDTDFSVRHETAGKLVENCRYLNLVENFDVQSEEEIHRLQARFVEEGYEGAMVRNRKGAYGINKRSSDLQKVKTFLDGEFRIVGFSEGSGNDAGTVIWECETSGGLRFNVRPRGTREARMEQFQNGRDYIGQVLTVRYQELTDDGIPRFPVGITIRDYE